MYACGAQCLLSPRLQNHTRHWVITNQSCTFSNSHETLLAHRPNSGRFRKILALIQAAIPLGQVVLPTCGKREVPVRSGCGIGTSLPCPNTYVFPSRRSNLSYTELNGKHLGLPNLQFRISIWRPIARMQVYWQSWQSWPSSTR